MDCPCGTGQNYETCCGPFHEGVVPAPTAEKLMRSRYTAFALKKMDYVERTTDPQTRMKFDFKANARWAETGQFQRLEILSASEDGNKGFVEFRAHYLWEDGVRVHHEKSRFRKQEGIWYYREGKVFEN